VIDRHDGNESPYLVNQTSNPTDIGSADGWFVELTNASGERITEPASVVAEAVFVTSFVPSADFCSAGGRSWLHRMAYRDGTLPDDGESDDFGTSRVISLDDGIASRAVVDISNETVIVQSSDATITIEEIGQAFFHLNVRAWQETYDLNSTEGTDTP
jgi:hypothetical protein